MDIFWWHLILSFIVGGIWLAAVSVIAERFGSRIGGIIGGIPSTVLIALVFIGLNEGTHFAAEATVVEPLAFIINCYFLFLWALLIEKGFFKSLASAGIFWFIATGATVLIDSRSMAINLLVWLVGLCGLIILGKRMLPIKDYQLSGIRFTFNQLMFRMLFAGTVIAFAVLVSRYFGSTIGGVFAAFPAVFISTFSILYFARGPRFVRAFSRSLMISSGVNTVVYSFSAYILFPRVGIFFGTFLAFLISIASAYYVVRYALAYLDN